MCLKKAVGAVLCRYGGSPKSKHTPDAGAAVTQSVVLHPGTMQMVSSKDVRQILKGSLKPALMKKLEITKLLL